MHSYLTLMESRQKGSVLYEKQIVKYDFQYFTKIISS
jgi:hypothetical protein